MQTAQLNTQVLPAAREIVRTALAEEMAQDPTDIAAAAIVLARHGTPEEFQQAFEAAMYAIKTDPQNDRTL